MKTEQELYEFCMQNICDLIDGKLSLDRIKKLREINFDFNYYIDDLLKVAETTGEEL
tara:strand:- start:507 stop:677 length:171 start_codon:yes stop_codon:yes gene_type:complete